MNSEGRMAVAKQRRFALHLENGACPSAAAAVMRISRSTLYRWQKRFGMEGGRNTFARGAGPAGKPQSSDVRQGRRARSNP